MEGPVTPPIISTWTRYSGVWEMIRSAGVMAPSTTTWTTANEALYMPFWFPFPYLVKRLFWSNGSAAGNNWDIGIYTPDGTRLGSSGSTAGSGNSAPQFVTLGTPVYLTPGRYYLGVVSSAVTANRSYGVGALPTVARCRMVGILQQATALPLPATATFAAASGIKIIPLAGFSRTASGF